MDVAIAIDAEAISVVRKRDAAGSYVTGGKYVEGAPASTPIRMAIQPASGRQLMDLDEGIRTEAKFMGWSRADLQLNDRIEVGDPVTARYKIIFVWPRPQDGFNRVALGLMK